MQSKTDEADPKRACQIEAQGHAEDIFERFDVEYLNIYLGQLKSSLIEHLINNRQEIVREIEHLNMVLTKNDLLIENLKK